MDLLMVAQPSGLWESILFWLESGIGNYAIAIILITIMIRLILLPIDFVNKYVTKKNNIKQIEMKPELDKLKTRYGENRDLLNKKTMELYKSKNYSVGGMCGILLAYLVVTMVVFFTLFGALNNVSYYKMYTEYETISTAYHTSYQEVIDAGVVTEGYDSLEIYADAYAGDKTIEAFENNKTGFLWIKSIWRPDTSVGSILDYKTFSQNVSKLKDVEVPQEDEYNKVMGALLDSKEYSAWNGYFILCVLAALTSFGSLYVNQLISKRRAKKTANNLLAAPGSDATANKGMYIIMPIIMGFFTLLYTASFGIYIVTSQLFALLSNILTTTMVDKMIEKSLKQDKKTSSSYDRRNVR